MTNNEANFIFGNMNSRGCGERLTLVSMIAALNTPVKSFDLTTPYRPKIAWLDESFDTKLFCYEKTQENIHNQYNVLS